MSPRPGSAQAPRSSPSGLSCECPRCAGGTQPPSAHLGGGVEVGGTRPPASAGAGRGHHGGLTADDSHPADPAAPGPREPGRTPSKQPHLNPPSSAAAARRTRALVSSARASSVSIDPSPTRLASTVIASGRTYGPG